MAASDTHFPDGTPYGHIRYTEAPPDYDGFGTRTIEWLPFQGKTNKRRFRKVSIPEAAKTGGWQEGRYASGLYACLTAKEWYDFQAYVSVPLPEGEAP